MGMLPPQKEIAVELSLIRICSSDILLSFSVCMVCQIKNLCAKEKNAPTLLLTTTTCDGTSLINCFGAVFLADPVILLVKAKCVVT